MFLRKLAEAAAGEANRQGYKKVGKDHVISITAVSSFF